MSKIISSSLLPYLRTIIIFSLLHFVASKCPNQCSGHGLCGAANTCLCYPGWNGGAADCSQSIYCDLYVDML
jgi:hypothetical protein